MTIHRAQIAFDPEVLRQARAKAARLGISFSEYLRRLIIDDLGRSRGKADISVLFDLGDSGEPTDIACDKDKMLGEAVWKEYLRKTRRRRRRIQRAVS